MPVPAIAYQLQQEKDLCNFKLFKTVMLFDKLEQILH